MSGAAPGSQLSDSTSYGGMTGWYTGAASWLYWNAATGVVQPLVQDASEAYVWQAAQKCWGIQPSLTAGTLRVGATGGYRASALLQHFSLVPTDLLTGAIDISRIFFLQTSINGTDWTNPTDLTQTAHSHFKWGNVGLVTSGFVFPHTTIIDCLVALAAGTYVRLACQLSTNPGSTDVALWLHTISLSLLQVYSAGDQTRALQATTRAAYLARFSGGG